MKTSRGLALGALASLALVSPSFASEDTLIIGEPGLPSAARDTTAPVKNPSTFAFPHRVTGEVVSVNNRAHAFTLKTLDGVTMLLMTLQASVPHQGLRSHRSHLATSSLSEMWARWATPRPNEMFSPGVS
jgi:hypothetical protein